ncbi:rhomboid family intramembrane serine protease [Bradyrhizobium sp. 149]|uniref:rhomboid family intramembrane serine protease n=1 Tax=Bradyrhizobium sp. 149 TaxID=2782624 RepID=UPI001FF99F69|nr:rhomboid family intramembrane serine protease [Bradyrhizobium sp. 149]MCK1651251.1 rhomboid family intramembrane serine protease [Bradyrhizobium sp. 149]
MAIYRTSPGFFEAPHAALYAVMTATVLASGLCLTQSGGGSSAPAELLYRYGGMYSGALPRHEYWRLFAYGFLHVNFVHLTTNMLCLVLWGGHLERRVGPAYFLIIYFCAMAFGAIVGNAIHASPYLTVGASGATSGILGALLCLSILGKLNLRFDFFAINIGLNVTFAISNSRIDWGVHLGGFAAGLIACALLDLVEKANAYALRCRFPEAVKVNLALLFCAAGLLVLTGQARGQVLGVSGWGAAIMFAVACAAIVKLVDVGLSMKKGLAIVVTTLAGANAVGVLLGGWAVASSECMARWPSGLPLVDNLLGAFCSSPVIVTALTSIGAFALTLWICSTEIHRGIEDVGFVGASLRAERRRRQGL